jgi:F0F1-type ATP synthase delta subunit
MAQLKLNHEIINRGDMHRIMRELNALDDFFVGAKARTPGTSVQMPKTSKILEQLAAENGIQLFEESHRQALSLELKRIDEQGPGLHMSFATEPSPKTLVPIVDWLRENIHPHVLLSVGYQPKIAAGCVMRTPNRIMDMSIGKHLATQVTVLNHMIEESVNGS